MTFPNSTFTYRDGSVMTDRLPTVGDGQSTRGVQLPDGRWARIGQSPHRGHAYYGDTSHYFLCQRGPSKIVPTGGETISQAASRLATDESIVSWDRFAAAPSDAV